MFGWLGVFSFIQLSYWGRIEAKYVWQKSIEPTSSMAWPEFCCRSSSWMKSCAIVKRACHAYSTHSIKYKRNVHKIDIKSELTGSWQDYAEQKSKNRLSNTRRQGDEWMDEWSIYHCFISFIRDEYRTGARLRQWRGEATQARLSIHWFLP